MLRTLAAAPLPEYIPFPRGFLPEFSLHPTPIHGFAMSYTVFVDGQEGTTGLQINEYLAQRSDIELLRIDADKRKDLA